MALNDVTEPSPRLDQIKEINQKFVKSHDSSAVKNKLARMKAEISANITRENEKEKEEIRQMGSRQVLASDRHQVRRKLLE